ncbi:unnamed protein product [Didymodactylos carnosus]|uniref:Uncharacterized protein n=2 Tax=Didymodactylos carnosus TaxID=1234261 RepID=A0A814NU18_9BILA|nr:unnamed protein product [Didymodactylos carnosus]CAF3863623.1 unnamed protein product [Didymodactylos carnosus]
MEQQFESEYHDPLEQLEKALATAKQIEQQLLAKLPDMNSLRKISSWYYGHKKQLFNEELRHKYPMFKFTTTTSTKQIIEIVPQIYYIHKQTTKSAIKYLIDTIRACKITSFVLDTESDPSTTPAKPSLIQILPVPSFCSPLLVILIEVQWLSPLSSSHGQLIKQLCDVIFQEQHEFIAWGRIDDELEKFRHFNLFKPSNIVYIRNMQKEFRPYYNHHHPHASDCPGLEQISLVDDELDLAVSQDSLEFDHDPDHELCTCEFRPYKDPYNPNAWSLQRAIALGFEQFLDKAYTCAKWSGGIDLNLGTWKFRDPVLRSQQELLRRNMEKYAANDVVSVLYIFQRIESQHKKKTTKIKRPIPN